VRLVATDLDGTLLRSDGTVSARTRQALAATVAAGVDVVILTARPPRYVNLVAEQLGISGVVVCSNGAMLYELATGRVTDVLALPLETARRVAAALAGAVPGVGFAIETGSLVVCEPGFVRRYDGDLHHDVPDLDEMWHRGVPIVKLLAWSASSTSDELVTAAVAAVGGDAECTHSGGTSTLEVSAAGVSKAAALAALCAARGIAAADVVAFGDMPNDLQMLGWAGTSYAVANAHPQVLAQASARTAANDDDGVALTLEHLLALI
jgi:Cof subfamily protein (haloacid dehalogenase superfamily)